MPKQKKPINWEIVEKKMEAGCSAREIASSFHICMDTFYDRFKEEYGRGFSDISDEAYSAGDGNLRFTQYMKALSGNINMLTLLGRERLGQGKEQEEQSPYEDILALRHENMLLKAQMQQIENINANQ